MSQITKRAIADSFIKIMEQKAMNKITIGDIAEECGISRMTFYYHFRDIYDLIEWICREDVEKVYKNGETFDTWQNGLTALCRIIYDKRRFAKNVYESFHREYLEKYIFQILFELIMHRVDQLSEGMEISGENRRYVARFYMYAILGMLIDWMKSDFKDSPEKVSERAGVILDGQIKNALENLEHYGQ